MIKSGRLEGKRIFFFGKLAGLSRVDSGSLIRSRGGTVARTLTPNVNLIVVGEAELLANDYSFWIQQLGEETKESFEAGQLEILPESAFWKLLGDSQDENHSLPLFTSSMIADLTGLPIATIRLWERRKLILPVKYVRNLAYFDYQEVLTAQVLRNLLKSGMSPNRLEQRLKSVERLFPGETRPLAQLFAFTEGKDVLLRQGTILIDQNGQQRIDFASFEPNEADQAESSTTGSEIGLTTGLGTGSNVPLKPGLEIGFQTGLGRESTTGLEGVFEEDMDVNEGEDGSLRSKVSEMLHCLDAVINAKEPDVSQLCEEALALEEIGALEQALSLYRVALGIEGPSPEVCFQVAELLVLLNDYQAARERYYMVLEMDENHVEARAKLGCVLAELGEWDLAIAAFQGALKQHPDYADVHFYLGRLYYRQNQKDKAVSHFQTFLQRCPESPWTEEVRGMLGE
ncbi:MAG: tetratricopeptide repeat protein [Thermoguttaceae bacterium]